MGVDQDRQCVALALLENIPLDLVGSLLLSAWFVTQERTQTRQGALLVSHVKMVSIGQGLVHLARISAFHAKLESILDMEMYAGYLGRS